MRARLPISASKLGSAFAPAPTPMIAIRPPVASALRLPARFEGADQLEHDVVGAVALEALGGNRLGTEPLHVLPQLSSAYGGRHTRTGGAPELDRRGAHASRSAMHEQVLAGTQPGLREGSVVGGREHLGQAARLGPVEPGRNRHRRALVHDGQLGLPAAPDDGHDAVARAEAAGGRPERHHLPGQLEARNVGGRAWGRRVGAPALQHVGAVEPRAAHADEDLTRSRRRIGAIGDRQPAVRDGYGAHGGGI